MLPSGQKVDIVFKNGVVQRADDANADSEGSGIDSGVDSSDSEDEEQEDHKKTRAEE